MGVASGWTMIRVRAATKERLQALARNLVALAEAETTRVDEVDPEPKNPACCGLSLDVLINRLISRVYGKRERAKKSRAARRRTRDQQGDATEGPTEQGG